MDQIKKEIKNYFEINTTPEIKPAILWDAFKAVLRGKRRSLNSKQRKKEKEDEEQLRIRKSGERNFKQARKKEMRKTKKIA